MKYTKEERLDIGKKVYTGEMSRYEAGEKYGISSNTARDYMRFYRDTYDLPAKRGTQKKMQSDIVSQSSTPNGIEEYESMTKEELIRELVKSKIAEARLKKGYEVKGDGTVIQYGRENTK